MIDYSYKDSELTCDQAKRVVGYLKQGFSIEKISLRLGVHGWVIKKFAEKLSQLKKTQK